MDQARTIELGRLRFKGFFFFGDLKILNRYI
jgi:hypothetical protein